MPPDTTLEKQTTKERENFTLSASVIILTGSGLRGPYDRPSVILGVKDSGLITLISGGLDKGEVPHDGVTRETREELGDLYDVIFRGEISFSSFCRIVSSDENKTSMGFAFLAKGNPLENDTHPTGADEVPEVRHLSLDEIADIVERELALLKENPEEYMQNSFLFKPEFNLPILIRLLEAAARADPYRVDCGTYEAYLSRFGVLHPDGSKIKMSDVVAMQLGSRLF